MNNEVVDSGRVSESGALPSCNERTPPDDPAAQLALLFVLCCTPSGSVPWRKLAADNRDQIDAVCLMPVRPDGAGKICPGNDFPGSAKKTVFQSGGCGMDGVHNPPF